MHTGCTRLQAELLQQEEGRVKWTLEELVPKQRRVSAKAFNEIRKRTGGKSGRAETSRLVRASIDPGKQKHGNDGGSSFLELFSQAASHLFLKHDYFLLSNRQYCNRYVNMFGLCCRLVTLLPAAV